MIPIAFAIFCAATASIPLLLALYRGERVRYRLQLLARQRAAHDIAWTAGDGRNYLMIRSTGRVLVMAA